MIGYLDTSAFVPLIIAEPASAACRRFWDSADAVVSCRLLYVETAAALAQATRMARLDAGGHDRARNLLDGLWSEMEVVELDQPLAVAAASCAAARALHGYDAVHCASALELSDPDLVAAAGDRRLLDAWHESGIATYDVHG